MPKGGSGLRAAACMIPVSLSSADDQGLQLQLKSGSQYSPVEQRGFELAVPPRPARGATTFELHPGNAQETSGVEQVRRSRLLVSPFPEIRFISCCCRVL